VLKTVSKTWQNIRLLKTEETTFANGEAFETAWTYNSNELQTERDDYDFGTTAPPNPPGPLLRKTVTNYASFGTNHIVDKPASVIVYDGGNNKAAEVDYTYDIPVGTVTTGIVEHIAGCNCGSLTKESRWVNGAGTTLNTTFTNDDTGQRLSMTDPRGNVTTYSYSDNYSSGTPPGQTNSYLTTITYPQTGSVSHIEKYSYAYASGQVTTATDQNNLVTTYKYVDNFARLTETDFPDGGQTTIAYNDSAYNASTPSPSVTTTKKINATASVVTLTAKNGLGQVIRSEVTSDPQGTIYTDTAYDGLGRVMSVSNPYRSGTDPTSSPGTTTFVYDGLGRKISETAPDNSVITTAYCAGSTLVTDPTGKWRRSRTDGLGRLVEVDEPNAVGATVASTGCPGTGEPIWVTSYTVDSLGNLKQVVQNGSRTRTFTYDFLSRLTSSSNPETGTITYNYDSDSNCASPNSFAGLLVSKVDARNIRTCAQYDALNRQTLLSYSNGDTSITTTYDQSACLGLSSCANIGHRTNVTDGAGSESWSFQTDPANLRSVQQNQRTTSGVTKSTTYYLDLAHNVTSIVYPTGRIVSYTYNAANRPITAQDSANGITYATAPATPLSGCLSGAVCYTPQGSIYSMSLGGTSSFTGLNILETFNNRLQPNEISASSTAGSAIDVTYNFVDPVSGRNASHVYGITNNLNSARSQSFTYDQVNRLVSAGTTATTGSYCWGYQYSYDAWGNLLSQAGWTPNYNGCSESTMGAVAADGNNHISGFSYDVSGNTLSDGIYSYTWNAEGQMMAAPGVTYSYDADGRRAAKVGSKLYWYGSGGEILAETTASGTTTAEYIFFGGRRIAMLPAGSNAQYYVEDFMGSSRVVTQNTGTVCYDADFPPYGQERAYANTCTQNAYKFEGKERDSETQNDEFGARNYSWRFGRWLSADWSSVPVPVPYANLTNPQTLNLYSMVADDPESFADLDGHVESLTMGNPSYGQPSCAFTGGGESSASATSGKPCDSNPSAQQAADQNTQNQTNGVAQNTSYTATILGQKVPVNITGGNAVSRAAIQGRLDAAIGVINQHAGDLSAADTETIHNIKSITVDDSKRTGPDPKGTENFMSTYINAPGSTSSWIASAFAHDAYHLTQTQRGEVYSLKTADRLEHEANEFQMRVGATFGLTKIQLDYIKKDTHTLYNTPPY
jgi:RHS repeat-associated protein